MTKSDCSISARADVYHSGFLGGSEVKQKGALNAGLRAYLDIRSSSPHLMISPLVDQELALKWVQQHVSTLDSSKINRIIILMPLEDSLVWRRQIEGDHLGRIRW